MPVEWIKGLLLTAIIFVPLERLLALHPNQRVFRRGWFTDLIYLVVNAQLISFALAVVAAGIVITASWLVPAAVQSAIAAQPHWLQFLEILVLSDVGFYCAHRSFHAVPWLWRFHAIHHSIKELDWLAGARVHPVDQVLTKGFSLLPVFSLGFSEIAIAMYIALYAWQSVLIHSNLRIRCGPLRWLIATPEFHHWHHSDDTQARNKNFAGQLPLLDFLFGTLHMPRDQVPQSYGIDEPIPTTYYAQLLYPLRKTLPLQHKGKAPTQ